VAALSGALESLLGDPARVSSYRQRARDRAGHHSWEAVTDQYERLLTIVYEARGPGPLPQVVLGPDLAPAA